MQSALEGFLKDKGYTESPISIQVFEVANKLHQWMKDPRNKPVATEFSTSVVCHLEKCIPPNDKFKTVQTRRERMWSNYHTLRCSLEYILVWKTFLSNNLQATSHPIFWQCIGDKLFKSIIKNSFSLATSSERGAGKEAPIISHQEANALRYAAGYIPRAVGKKLKKSNDPQKARLWLCLLDVLDDGDKEHTDSEDWIELIDRGGLTHINDIAFQAFLAMEIELRKHLDSQCAPPNFKTDITKKVLENEDVAFYWSILSADWEEQDSQALLELMVNMFITIRGFSYASAWVEKYKAASAKSLQKSKGLRKTLIGGKVLSHDE